MPLSTSDGAISPTGSWTVEARPAVGLRACLTAALAGAGEAEPFAAPDFAAAGFFGVGFGVLGFGAGGDFVPVSFLGIKPSL